MKKLTLYCTLAMMMATTGARAQEVTRTVETPTMGWSSWNTFALNISESIIKGQADAMVSRGFKAAGYTYINIDDGFFGGRDANGKLKIHPTRFPNGIKVVADYIHSKGLKAGIYSDAGYNTCGNYHGGDATGHGVGFYEHDQQDANFYFGECGFDFIKVDFCGGDPVHNEDRLSLDVRERYTSIRNAINNTGRTDVRLNICRWAFPGTWASDIAVSWRTTGDIGCWWTSVRDILIENLYLSGFCGEGSFNDMDMLEVGRGLKEEEDKTHFGMWCMMDSPLLIGCNMNSIDTKAKNLLQNPELIALNQDTLCLQAYVAKRVDSTYVMVKDIEQRHGPVRAVALMNLSDRDETMSVNFEELDLGGRIRVRDLFARRDVGEMEGRLSMVVPAHATRIYRLEADKRYTRRMYEAETAFLTKYQEIDWWSGNFARAEQNGSASGGTMVSYLGNKPENDMLWRDVYVPEEGDYTLTLGCLSQETRSLTVAVNGEDVKTFSINSGSWNKVKTQALTVHLRQGSNQIRLYNRGNAWAPNIDYMTIERVGGTEQYERQLVPLRTDIQELIEGGHLPAGFMGTLQQDIAACDSADQLDADAYGRLITQLKSHITEAANMAPVYAEYEEWMQSATSAEAVTAECDEKSAFAQEIAEMQQRMDEANTKTKVNTVLTSLKSALKAYLKNENVTPVPGEKMDITLLLNNPQMTVASGWTGSPTYTDGVAQFTGKRFNCYQALSSMKPGYYQMEVNALYRIAANDGGKLYRAGKEEIPAMIYLGTDSVQVKSLYAHRCTLSALTTTGNVLNYYANTPYAAAVMFQKGYYAQTATYHHEATGALRMGITSKSSDADSWCCFDNFRLLYLGTTDPTGVQQIAADPTPVDDATYDLQGRRVQSKARRGIYITGGKKVIAK